MKKKKVKKPIKIDIVLDYVDGDVLCLMDLSEKVLGKYPLFYFG